MILRVKLSGSGVERDPYRVAFPTYTLIHGNITRREALVYVPDDVHGLSSDDLTHETKEETTEGDHYPKLCDECVEKVHTHLDERYSEHAGKFRIEGVQNV